MPTRSQIVAPGFLENAYHREHQKLIAGNALARLWAKDASLWPIQEQRARSIHTDLSWLDVPAQMGPYIAQMKERVARIEAEGFEDWVFVALGGANLAAETILRLGAAKLGKRFLLLDSTDPLEVLDLIRTLNLHRSVFVVASKSGKKIALHALLLYLLDRIRSAGIASPGRQFVALTDENSYLAALAQEYGFSGLFLDPGEIPVCYSGLIQFGFLLCVACRIDSEAVLSPVAAMRDACGPSASYATNPAMILAALLAAGALDEANKLVLVSPPSLVPFCERIAQLVGTSTGKGGKGIIPILDDSPNARELFQQGSVVTLIKMRGHPDGATQETETHLQRANVPNISIELDGPEDLAAELFKWELATALTCSLIGVDPFDEPDVQDARERSSLILEHLVTKHELSAPTVRIRESGLELTAENSTRQQISTLSFPEAFRTFFALRELNGYLGVLAFVERNPTTVSQLRRLREHLATRLGIPVQLSFGPRYLHICGQSYKGGPAKGMFLILTAEPGEDLAIPGANYTFGQLQLALALGDFESLWRHQRPVLRVHLTQGPHRGLEQLEGVIAQSLTYVRSMAR